MGSLVLLDLMGGVALLLWGLHMVHSGILRAFGPDLRLLLARALRNRFTALGAGLGLTALLQSSTATALITSSFAAEEIVSLVPALAIMLGANIGTTLIVQVLSFNVAAVAPVLFIVGLVAFRSGPRSRIKDLGRVAIGLGLMLLALHILLDTMAPAENAPGVRVFLNGITGDPVLCILIGAFVTWLVHSSVASVLLVMSLAYSQFISPYAAFALVLGANLGSAINPLMEGARRDNPASYRLPVGNLVNRVVGILLVAPFLRPITETICTWQPDLAKATALFHIAFNVATALLFIGVLDHFARLLERLLPKRAQETDPSRPRYLDESALDYSQFISPYAAFALVLGANLGSAINPLMEGARRRRARGAAYGRPCRGDVAQGDGGDADQRSRAGRPCVEDGQHRRPAERGDQALRHEAYPRQPR
jgi:phosphate:Na+ symporter